LLLLLQFGVLPVGTLLRLQFWVERQCGLPRALLACGRVWSRRGRRRSHGRAFADRLTVVDANHHHDELGLVGGERFLYRRDPITVAPWVVADQSGIGAILAQDGKFWLLRKGVFEAVGEPVGHGVADDHDGGRRGSVGLALRRRRTRIVRGRLALLVGAAEPASERVIVWLRTLLLLLPPLPRSVAPRSPAPRSPELRVRG